ncbi:MAG: hypothetical protein ACTHQE_08915 [Thermomicrobiales bacterium]
MDWAAIGGIIAIVLIGGGVLAAIVGPAATHWFQGRQERAKEARQVDREESLRRRDTQREILTRVQGAMEQLNLSLVRWGAGKLAAAQVMSLHPEQFARSNGWPQQLPPQEFEDLADQGEATLRMLIPAIADPEVRHRVEEFQRQARNAFHGDNPEATSQAVRKAREEQEAANARIGLLLQDL